MIGRTMLKSTLLVSCAVLPAAVAAQEAIPTIEVVGVAPVPGGEIDVNKVPSNVQTIPGSDLAPTRTPSLLDGMVQSIPFVSLSDQSGNAFQRNLDYRGFNASPVPGTPQGIAVYQNGSRINEAFGDVVNWDLIPEMAIARMTLMPNNPLFGLNATGGAMSIDMKNGFTYQGNEAVLRGGSFGRISAGAQSGYQKDNFSAYVAGDTTYDRGWRDFSSSSQIRRMYVDLGAKGDQTEFHVSFTGADNKLGGTVATPVEMLNRRWSSVYTWPQTTHLQLAFLQANASWTPTDTLTLQGNAYFRSYRAAHVDANGSDAQPCDPGVPGVDPALAGQMCIGDPGTPLNINMPVFNTLAPNSALGEIDRNTTTSNSFGGSLQATSTAQLFGHDNHFVVGTSVDRGHSNFQSSSELGTIDQSFFVTGTGVFIDQPGADLAPVNLGTNNTYVGVYLTNTFDITSQLSFTAGGRYNFAQINLQDLTGTNPLLTSQNQFQRFNPVVGLTYKITPNMSAYAGYSEANRAPTPLELGCSDPAIPCQIDNFLLADPPLKQVVSRTIEGGLRGEISGGGASAELVTKAPKKADAVADGGWRLRWGLSVFRTVNSDDIINIASQVPGHGFFQNAGTTRRQGVEAKVDLGWNRWTAYANYTFIDATYQDFLTLSSPNNPMAVGGLISVVPGDHIPGIPAQRFKAGAEYAVTDAWKIGADLNVVGSQWLIHDDSNLNAKVPAYWVVNMHTSYQVTKNIALFGLVQNLFNQHYYSAGTFFDTGGFNNSTLGGANLLSFNDPRTFLPGMPLAIYGGLKATF